jgi:hypothetical protein
VTVAGLDVSKLGPGDAVAALRSFPRRYRALLSTFDDDEKPDDLVHRAGPDGLSAVDHVEHVARSVAMLDRALHDVLQQNDVVLSPATFDDAAREWQVASGDPSLDAALDFLTVECEALADAVERVPAEAWARRAKVAGDGRSVTALDIVREAVRTAAEHLRAAERTLATVRGR